MVRFEKVQLCQHLDCRQSVNTSSRDRRRLRKTVGALLEMLMMLLRPVFLIQDYLAVAASSPYCSLALDYAVIFRSLIPFHFLVDVKCTTRCLGVFQGREQRST
jgi:hypothetical protein